MKTYKILIFPGIMIWLFTFFTAMVLFPFHDTNRPLFESLIAAALALFTVIFTNRYFRKINNDFIAAGIRSGFTWMIINLCIDLPLFLQGPMQMSFVDYLSDIGLTYLIIPTITISAGLLVESKLNKGENK